MNGVMAVVMKWVCYLAAPQITQRRHLKALATLPRDGLKRVEMPRSRSPGTRRHATAEQVEAVDACFTIFLKDTSPFLFQFVPYFVLLR